MHLGGSLLSDRDLILSLRQRRNDGSDSRQLSIQSRLQLLEGGLDFRWRPAIALIDEQSDYAIDFAVCLYGKSFFGFREARVPRTFILVGIILVAVGLLWPWIGWLR